MRCLLFSLSFLWSAGSLFAQDLGFFGLENEALGQLFLQEALVIANEGNTTRDPINPTELNPSDPEVFGVLREAYRADPEATLALIERILEAGRRR